MRWTGTGAAATLCIGASLLLSCDRSDSTTDKSIANHDDSKTLNFYNWADYISPDTIASFEKLTGIKVRLSTFETNEILESKILTGHSGYDVVVPTAPFLQRQIRSGAYLPLDKRLLPNLKNLDAAIMARAALNDPGNSHAVVYMWGTYGIGYNPKRVADALPNAPLTSWRLIFDPAMAAKLAECGINLLDAPAGIERLVLKYLGRDPNAPTVQDFADVETLLMRIRPYIRNIDSSIDTEELANADICVALMYNGSFSQAHRRAGGGAEQCHTGLCNPRRGIIDLV